MLVLIKNFAVEFPTYSKSAIKPTYDILQFHLFLAEITNDYSWNNGLRTTISSVEFHSTRHY